MAGGMAVHTDRLEHDRDGLRLLSVIRAYTGVPEDGAPSARWLKEYVLSVIVSEGIKQGVFSRYSRCPSLFEFRGVERFALVSQEIWPELNDLANMEMVEKIVISTCFYAPMEGVRITTSGKRYLDEHGTSEDLEAVDRLTRCQAPHCGQLFDYAVLVNPAVAAGEASLSATSMRLFKVCRCAVGTGHCGTDGWGSCLNSARRNRRGRVSEVLDFFSIGGVAYTTEPYVADA